MKRHHRHHHRNLSLHRHFPFLQAKTIFNCVIRYQHPNIHQSPPHVQQW